MSQGLPPERRSQRKPSKKLRVIICVLLVELCERFTFFGIVCNMILFCTVKLGYDNRLAATVNLCFIGASTLSPVLVGWFAETVLGRTKVLYLCTLLHFFGKRSSYKHYMAPKKQNTKPSKLMLSCPVSSCCCHAVFSSLLSSLGTVMLPVVAFPFEDFYIDTHHMLHRLEAQEQQILFYTGLLAAALGIGGIRAVLCPMGAYSLQTYNQHQLLSFFNWWVAWKQSVQRDQNIVSTGSIRFSLNRLTSGVLSMGPQIIKDVSRFCQILQNVFRRDDKF